MTDTSYTVSVRALCEFTAKRGSLDMRFTPSPSAREGVEGHLWVTRRRPDHYRAEVPLKGHYNNLTVRGRADGYDPEQGRLEEIKTFRGSLDLIPDNHRALHWAQAKVYGALLCEMEGLESIELALVYFDIVRQEEHHLTEHWSADKLKAEFEIQCEAFILWAEQELAHRERRNLAAMELQFPYVEFRSGQRPLAEAVYQSAATGRCLLAEAPTGTGKTLGTLFPLIKALATQSLDKVFFLTAKTPGRQLALDALQTLDLPELRTLELVAREKSCEHPDKACHGDSCPLAKGFYDRLPEARQAAARERCLNQARLREIALAHELCPYYLSQEMARWSDVIIGDYNYYFDQSAMLFALTQTHQWRTALLVDEAHNLIERARGMYSAELDQQRFRRTKKQAPKALKSRLESLNRSWNEFNRSLPEGRDTILQSEPPEALIGQLQLTAAAITDYLAEHPFALDSELMQFYFDALQFLRIAELFDERDFLCDIEWRRPPQGNVRRGARRGTVINLRNLIPAAQLKPRFEGSHSATLFSATLNPARYYCDLLGLPDNSVAMTMPSPFSADQLTVHTHRQLSTRYHDRAQSIAPIADLIAEQYHRQTGNYLAFFSSYDYLQQVHEHLDVHYPDVPTWAQERKMNEAARAAFLAAFQEHSSGVGFAVLGGAFGEGIDLPGKRLIGAFVATLGLPQMNPINDALKQRLEEQFGQGYDYAYLYPGLRKVVQAAGRVIRGEGDTGVIHLIDDRFAQPGIRRLLPDWWALEQ